MMRVVLFAPTPTSLYSRLVAHELHRQSGVDLVAIYIRRLWSYKRIQTDLRREGPRLLQKIYEKLIVSPIAADRAKQTPLVNLAIALGLEFTNLVNFCQKNGVLCHKVYDFNSASSEAGLKELSPDLIVFTGGGLIRRNILEIPDLGVLNCHSGLLPRYRGMDTLEWAILEAKETLPQVGLTLHFMDSGVDTGSILRRHIEELRPGETLDTVRKRLEPEMVRLISTGVHDLQRGELEAEAQEHSAGRQYFVIHPRLAAQAALKLSQSAGAS
jgi:methionyl-tRNA formyltransferase